MSLFWALFPKDVALACISLLIGLLEISIGLDWCLELSPAPSSNLVGVPSTDRTELPVAELDESVSGEDILSISIKCDFWKVYRASSKKKGIEAKPRGYLSQWL